RARIDFPLFGRSELLGTGEGWRSNESRLSLLGTAFCFWIKDFSDAVINHFNNRRAAAWIRLQHNVGGFDIAMHHAAGFGCRQGARNLLDDFQCQPKRQRTFTSYFAFKCFALDELHHVETLTGFFAIMTDPRDIRMADLRGRPRFTQKTRSDSGHLRDFSVYDFQCDDGIQNRISRAISDRHRAGAELNRKTVRRDFDFEVIVLQRSRRQSPACVRFSWFLTVAQKTEISETTKAFAFWTYLRERSSTDRACSNGWFGFHTAKSGRPIELRLTHQVEAVFNLAGAV